MKKTILTFATLAILATGSAMAQRGYNNGYDRSPAPNPGYNAPYNQYPNQANPRFDDAQDWYRIERLDEIVNLSRGQKRDIKRIEDRYDRLGLTPGGRLYPPDAQRLQWQKQQDVMAVLNPAQRNVLYAYQQSRRPNRGGLYGRRG